MCDFTLLKMVDFLQWMWDLPRNVPSVFLVVALSAQIIQGFQTDILTSDELQQVFGGSWKPTASEYSLFRPTVPKSFFRRKREISDPSSVFEFNALGESFRFRIEPTKDLVSDMVALLGRNGTNSYFLDNREVKNCAYHGYDERQETRTIALVMCGNLRGVVTSPTEELVIEPLPETISRHRGRYRRSSSHRLNEHIIYRRKGLTSCPLKEGSRAGPSLDSLERDYLHSRFTSPLMNHHNLENEKDTRYFNKALTSPDEQTNDRKSETYYIETAVFVDRDLLKHMQTNFPTNTEEEVIQVVLAMVNAVQLLYNDPSLEYKIHFVLKRLELLYQDPRGLSRPHDIDEFLTKFCSWQHLENPLTDGDPFHWDHALILTGLDLYTVIEGGKINSQVVGLAPVAGMCTRTSSCTVNEGRHFESVYVVAHEIGHNLGMRHDGLQSGNNCDPSGYLMSPTLGSGKVTWSHCSQKYLAKFLDTPQSECLRDEPTRPAKELDHEGRMLPGQRFSADQQCMLKYGVGSRSSSTQKPDEVCRDLHCIRDQYTWTSHPALEGTRCEQNMWCRRGHCVNIPRAMQLYDSEKASIFLPISSSSGSSSLSAPYSSDAVGIGGEWGRWSECQSSCLYGNNGILSAGSTGLSASKRQCHSCTGEYRYRSCSAARECSVRQKKTLQDFADEICRRLIRDDSSLTGHSIRLPITGIQTCQVECLSTNRSPVTTRVPFPDGTVCHSDATNFPTYCISGFCTEFRCETNALYGASPHICRSDSVPLPGPLASPLDSISARTTSSPPPPTTSNFGEPVETVTDSSTIGEHLWGPWVMSSECKVSCISPSKGIQLVSRDCLHVYGCAGLNRNIRLCTTEQTVCSLVQSPFTYANDVCQRYSKSVKQLSGFGMQLSSTSEDPNRACTVACQDSALKYRFYKVNGKDGWFPFGTDCSSEKNAFESYCINGKCLEFNADGTPLRNNVGQLLTRAKSRALELFAPINPLLRGIIPTTFMEDEGLQHHWLFKRDLESTSHRLPGSFEDSFLLSLIDEINATFTGNVPEGAASLLPVDVDLENPLFFGAISNDSSSNVTGRVEGNQEGKSNPFFKDVYTWRPISSYCSAVCDEGILMYNYRCTINKETIVDASFCAEVTKPDTTEPCHSGISCGTEALHSRENKTKNSPFERWLVELVDEIKSTVH